MPTQDDINEIKFWSSREWVLLPSDAQVTVPAQHRWILKFFTDGALKSYKKEQKCNLAVIRRAIQAAEVVPPADIAS